MSRVLDIPYNEYIGGEASIFPFSKMPPKYSILMQNCHVSERGGIAKIPGYEKLNSTTVTVTLKNGFEFKKSDGTSQVLCAGGGKIFKLSGGELSEIHAGLDGSAKVFFTQMNDICIITNGVDAPLKYDGTTVSALGGTPPSTAIKAHVFKNRAWMNDATDKMKATHSALDNPEDYTTADDAGYIDFKFILPEGDELLDIQTYIDLIVFIFRNHIVIYSGSNPTGSGDFAIVQIFNKVGIVGAECAISVGDDLAFYHDSGIKSFKQVVTSGSLNLKNISENTDPTLRDITSPSVFSTAHYPKQGWLMFLINTTVWLYSYTWKAWARMVGADVNGMFSSADGKTLYLCGTGFLYQYGSTYAFAGNNIDMIWDTAWLRFDKAGRKFYPKFMDLVTYPHGETTIDFYQRFDLNNAIADSVSSFTVAPDNITYIDSVLDWDAIDPFDEILRAENRIPLFGGGRTMLMRFRNQSDVAVEINDMTIHGELGGI